MSRTSSRLSNYALHDLYANRDVHTSNSTRSWYRSSDNEFYEDISTGSRGGIGFAFQVVYVLFIFFLITLVGSLVVFFNSRHDFPVNSILSVQSFTLFTVAC